MSRAILSLPLISFDVGGVGRKDFLMKVIPMFILFKPTHVLFLKTHFHSHLKH
jgi:hypothetical protein